MSSRPIPMEVRPATRHSELADGWASLAGVVLAFVAGVFCLPYYTAGLFVLPLHESFGWSRTQVASGTSVMMASFALTSPFIGWLTDRIDPRRLVPIGMLAVSIGLFVLSRTPGQVSLYLATIAAMAIIGNLCGTVAMMPILTTRFIRARGTAIGIAMAGIGLGAAAGNPIVARIISDHGWRAAYMAMSAFSLLSAPVVFALLRSDRRAARPAPETAIDGDTVRDALTKPAFWILALAILAVAIASSGLVIHFVPLLIDEGQAPAVAAWQAGLIGIAVIAGRLLTGALLDRVFAPRLAAGLMLAAAAGFGAFLAGGADLALGLIVAIGLSFGAEVDLVGYMVSRYFGPRNYGRLFGINYSVCILGMMLSPICFGLVRDHANSYRPMLFLSLALLGLATVLFLMLPPFTSTSSESADPRQETA